MQEGLELVVTQEGDGANSQPLFPAPHLVRSCWSSGMGYAGTVSTTEAGHHSGGSARLRVRVTVSQWQN